MNILFALVSIFFIYPILYFLPVRMNGKQKFFLLMLSLFIALTGILSINILPLWQTMLMMLALVGLLTIVINKRMPETIPYENNTLIDNQLELRELHVSKSLLNDSALDVPKIHIYQEHLEKVEDEIIDDYLKEDISKFEEFLDPQFLEKSEVIFEEFEIHEDNPTIDSFYEELETNLFVESKEKLEDEMDEYLSDIERLLKEEEIETSMIKADLPTSDLKKMKLEKLF